MESTPNVIDSDAIEWAATCVSQLKAKIGGAPAGFCRLAPETSDCHCDSPGDARRGNGLEQLP
ncbi:hypothetical protein LMG27174_01224 [Paraburkholderia rhynchosiae]|uniref:Uncharacterized protein n=1 Tax=Paraburkholderia rhynchosiae TaxID=487049 RepID=A0A6J5A3X3_9BURK|nr:hypothetical protein LMG27174_01224 [Paraburkholderia rhynchosiae]